MRGMLVRYWDAFPLQNRVQRGRYNYTFGERLQIDPREHKIMLTEAANNPKKVHGCGHLTGLDVVPCAAWTIRQCLMNVFAFDTLQNRQQLVEVMFETFDFEGVQVSIQAVLTLYAQVNPV